MGKCCRQVLWGSVAVRVVKKCCGEVLWRSVVKECWCRDVVCGSVVEALWGSAAGTCCEEVLWRSVGKECCEGVL